MRRRSRPAPGAGARGSSREALRRAHAGGARGALSYHDADGRARQEETRPAHAPARDGARRRRLRAARQGAAHLRRRASRHRLVLRARSRTRPSDPEVVEGARRRARRWPGPAGASTPGTGGTTRRPGSARRSCRSGAPASTRWPSSRPWPTTRASTSRPPSGSVDLARHRQRPAPLDAARRPAARDEPGARRAPRLRLVAGRRRARAAPQRRASACGAIAWALAPSPRPCSSTARSTSAPRTARLTALDARNGHRRWRVHVGGADQGLAGLQRRPAGRRLLRRPRLRLQRAHRHAALEDRGPRHATAVSGRATSTPRRRSPTGASTSARPTAACTRSSPRPARSPGRPAPAATSTPGPRSCTRRC